MKRVKHAGETEKSAGPAGRGGREAGAELRLGVRVPAEPYGADSGPRWRGEGRSLRPVRTEAGGAALRARWSPTAIPGTPRARMRPDCQRSAAGRSGSDACTHRLVAASHCCARALTAHTGNGSQRLSEGERRCGTEGISAVAREGSGGTGCGLVDWFDLWAGTCMWHDLGRVLATLEAQAEKHNIADTFFLSLFLKIYFILGVEEVAKRLKQWLLFQKS